MAKENRLDRILRETLSDEDKAVIEAERIAKRAAKERRKK